MGSSLELSVCDENCFIVLLMVGLMKARVYLFLAGDGVAIMAKYAQEAAFYSLPCCCPFDFFFPEAAPGRV